MSHPLQSNWPVKTKSIDCDRIKKDGWLEHGILVVKRDELPNVYRDMVDVLGEFIYGSREK